MKEVHLSQGKVALVDDADFEWLNQWKWRFNKRGYAERSSTCNGKVIRTKMHRLILGTPIGMETDHINGNALDNRRVNLRVCTKSQNMMNRRKGTGCSSQYKGVCWHKGGKKWQATIGGRYLGLFNDERIAALAYNEAAESLFGEFARRNALQGEGQ